MFQQTIRPPTGPRRNRQTQRGRRADRRATANTRRHQIDYETSIHEILGKYRDRIESEEPLTEKQYLQIFRHYPKPVQQTILKSVQWTPNMTWKKYLIAIALTIGIVLAVGALAGTASSVSGISSAPSQYSFSSAQQPIYTPPVSSHMAVAPPQRASVMARTPVSVATPYSVPFATQSYAPFSSQGPFWKDSIMLANNIDREKEELYRFENSGLEPAKAANRQQARQQIKLLRNAPQKSQGWLSLPVSNALPFPKEMTIMVHSDVYKYATDVYIIRLKLIKKLIELDDLNKMLEAAKKRNVTECRIKTSKNESKCRGNIEAIKPEFRIFGEHNLLTVSGLKAKIAGVSSEVGILRNKLHDEKFVANNVKNTQIINEIISESKYTADNKNIFDKEVSRLIRNKVNLQGAKSKLETGLKLNSLTPNLKNELEVQLKAIEAVTNKDIPTRMKELDVMVVSQGIHNEKIELGMADISPLEDDPDLNSMISKAIDAKRVLDQAPKLAADAAKAAEVAATAKAAEVVAEKAKAAAKEASDKADEAKAVETKAKNHEQKAKEHRNSLKAVPPKNILKVESAINAAAQAEKDLAETIRLSQLATEQAANLAAEAAAAASKQAELEASAKAAYEKAKESQQEYEKVKEEAGQNGWTPLIAPIGAAAGVAGIVAIRGIYKIRQEEARQRARIVEEARQRARTEEEARRITYEGEVQRIENLYESVDADINLIIDFRHRIENMPQQIRNNMNKCREIKAMAREFMNAVNELIEMIKENIRNLHPLVEIPTTAPYVDLHRRIGVAHHDMPPPRDDELNTIHDIIQQLYLGIMRIPCKSLPRSVHEDDEKYADDPSQQEMNGTASSSSSSSSSNLPNLPNLPKTSSNSSSKLSSNLPKGSSNLPDVSSIINDIETEIAALPNGTNVTANDNVIYLFNLIRRKNTNEHIRMRAQQLIDNHIHIDSRGDMIMEYTIHHRISAAPVSVSARGVFINPNATSHSQRLEAQQVEAQRLEAQRLEAQRLEAQRLEAQRVLQQEEEQRKIERQRYMVREEARQRTANVARRMAATNQIISDYNKIAARQRTANVARRIAATNQIISDYNKIAALPGSARAFSRASNRSNAALSANQVNDLPNMRGGKSLKKGGRRTRKRNPKNVRSTRKRHHRR
jgi:hypothetical protein